MSSTCSERFWIEPKPASTARPRSANALPNQKSAGMLTRSTIVPPTIEPTAIATWIMPTNSAELAEFDYKSMKTDSSFHFAVKADGTLTQ